MTACLLLLAPLAGGVANLCTQAVWHRFTQRFMQSIVLGFSGGGVVTAVCSYFLLFDAQGYDADGLSFFVGNGMIYGAGGYLLFHFVNSGEASIRFRILRELQNEGKPISETDLRIRYNDDLILRARLDRLLGNGVVRYGGGHYALADGTVLEVIARLMMSIKRFLIRRESEFELRKPRK